MVDACICRFRNDRLCVEGDAKSRFTDHAEIVGAVAHRQRFLMGQPQLIAQANQRRDLRFTAKYRLGDAAGEFSVDEDEPVRLVRVEADSMRHALGKKR